MQYDITRRFILKLVKVNSIRIINDDAIFIDWPQEL